jgi:hypothetical protein
VPPSESRIRVRNPGAAPVEVHHGEGTTSIAGGQEAEVVTGGGPPGLHLDVLLRHGLLVREGAGEPDPDPDPEPQPEPAPAAAADHDPAASSTGGDRRRPAARDEPGRA